MLTSPLIREQHFGEAEGQPFGMYPHARKDRTAKFPDGESLTDVEKRAEEVLEEILLPYVWRERTNEEGGEGEMHVAVVSHGIFLRELISAIMRRGVSTGSDYNFVQQEGYRGMRNTAWTRVTVQVRDRVSNFE